METKPIAPEQFLRERNTDCYCPIAPNPDGSIFGVTLGLNLIRDTPSDNTIREFEINDDGEIQIYLYRERL